ncbi:hypothetical protein QBC45DRAFT_483465 [Copromyces sp. CBS 386.78]|nr:hypothetical protein QBC45DRAFT_483465 [Copromyces sp. CBS 386.78]
MLTPLATYYREIPADTNLQIDDGFDDVDAVHDDYDDVDADEITLVSGSEDDAVQNETSQLSMKIVPASFVDDTGHVANIEDATFDSLNLEEELADAKRSTAHETMEYDFFEGETDQTLDPTASKHNAGAEIVITEHSDSLNGLITAEEENDPDASDFKDEDASAEDSIIVLTKFSDDTVQHPHGNNNKVPAQLLERDDDATSSRGNCARPFYAVIFPVSEITQAHFILFSIVSGIDVTVDLLPAIAFKDGCKLYPRTHVQASGRHLLFNLHGVNGELVGPFNTANGRIRGIPA